MPSSSRAIFALAGLSSIIAAKTTAHAEEPMHSGSLAHALDRVSNTGRVLYIAAHPDDENTRLLAHLANGKHLTVAYLSMTRGGGGQNLIGAEQAELLDVIRTEELLAARRLDGAVQRFTRMRDFGYSKSAAETLAVWGHEEALFDVVWAIRSFQPDLIVSRFDEQPPNHGHHTASAILAREAFAAAADPARFPEQLLAGVEPWQAVRLMHNVSTWREGPPPAGALPLDVGGYDPRLGLSYGELAALSRSQHKSQGFGVQGERGALIERFVHVAGTRANSDIFEGIDPSWRRFGARASGLEAALGKARGALDRDTPERALPALLEAHRALEALPSSPRVTSARAGLERVILAATGLFLRATAPVSGAVPGSAMQVKLELVLRRPASVRARKVSFPGLAPVELAAPLGVHDKQELSRDVTLPVGAPISVPYWLADRSLDGRHVVADRRQIGDPVGPEALVVRVELLVGERPITVEVPVEHVWTDRVHGERSRRFLVLPPATVSPAREAVLLPNGKRGVVDLRVRAGQDTLEGTVQLGLPEGWRSSPATISVSLAKAGEEQTVRFEVAAPANAAAIEIEPRIEVTGRSWSLREDLIDHAHIPVQLVLQPARLRLVPLSLELPKGRIGYVPGSGDTIAEDLEHAGATVEILDAKTLRSGDLGRYAAILVGIRAYNTRPLMRSVHGRLMAYVERGGTVVVQYNTTSRFEVLDTPVGPYPMEVGRERVTDQNAQMVPVDPKHPVLTWPNRLGPDDFAGWVQERGLYFATKLDPRYQAVFQIADPGEAPLLGGVVVARHGRGRYVYTGLSFFRQLPAGVPGAYRLLANLLSKK